MALPEKDTRAIWWGLERWTGENGNGKWERIQACPADRDPEKPGALARWFPIETYSEKTIRAACGPGTFRVYFQPRTKHAKWPVSEAFSLLPDEAPPLPLSTPPAPSPAPAPPTQPAPPTTLAPARPVPVPIGPFVPDPIRHGQPGVTGDVVGGFERLHHLASSDASQVTTAVAALAQGFNQAVAQMAAVTIAMSGQRAADAQATVQALMAQSSQPNPQLAAIAQQLRDQNAAIAALAAAQSETKAQLDELAEDDEDERGIVPAGGAEQTDGQKIASVLVPLAVEYGPKIAAKLWPDQPTPQGDAKPGA